ncbi:sensor histidine kinase [Singulisphaera sp. PoT]|uniref:sensor histidine kinase n=1 Tax=Singulisphaera sp. PoT TaxID=3411797 RepID=UPI003BF4AC3D
MLWKSIRTRLTAWYGGLLLVTFSGLGLAAWMLMAQSLLDRVDALLDFEFKEASERLGAGLSAEGLTHAPVAFQEVFYLRILMPDGRLLAESSPLKEKDIHMPDFWGESPDTRYDTFNLGSLGQCRVVTGRVGLGEGQRIVQIATSLDSYHGELAQLRGVLLTILPAVLLAATLGGFWLAKHALAPVERMTEDARRISAENLGERIEVANPGDELGRLAITLNAMLDRIDRSFVATRRFTADAAHELKTPLASIRTEAEVALLARRSFDDYEETLRSIVEEAERLSRLIESLLLLSREDASERLTSTRVRIDELVRMALAAAESAAFRSQIGIEAGELPGAIVEGDPTLLHQVFENLLDNAIKYSVPGGRVSVSGRLEAGSVEIAVADNGVGIPEEALGRVFDRFYRVDSSRSRRTGGSGLGLSIVKAVVDRHGGSVSATSTRGAGSCFLVRLPVQSSLDKVIL